MSKESPDLHRRLFRVPHLAAAGMTIQTGNNALREMSTEYFLLVLVRCGTRTVRRGTSVCVAHAGEAILMTPGAYDVTNAEAPTGEPYRSDWLAWDTDLVALPEEGASSMPVPADGALRLPSVDGSLEEAFSRASKAIETGDRLPRSILQHRVLEVLLWLRVQGFHLMPRGKPSIGDQIRTMVRDDPAADWSMASLAAAFSTSEATLRRRLAAEGIQAKDLIAEARMLAALAMLLSTDLPISRIAMDNGYASASRFAVRFRNRFELTPSEMRGHHRAV